MDKCCEHHFLWKKKKAKREAPVTLNGNVQRKKKRLNVFNPHLYISVTVQFGRFFSHIQHIQYFYQGIVSLIGNYLTEKK